MSDDRITTIRSLIDLVSSDTSETGPIPDVLHACSESLVSLAADLAAADKAINRQAIEDFLLDVFNTLDERLESANNTQDEQDATSDAIASIISYVAAHRLVDATAEARATEAEAQNESLRESVERLTRRLDLQEQDLNRSGFALGISATRRESLEHVVEIREAERDAAVARANTLAEAAEHVLRHGKVGKQSEARLRAALGEARDD